MLQSRAKDRWVPLPGAVDLVVHCFEHTFAVGKGGKIFTSLV